MFFRTTWSLRSFPCSSVAPDALLWQCSFFTVSGLLLKTWASSSRAMGHSHDGEDSKLPALPLVSLSDHLSCCRDWWYLVESPPDICFQSPLAEQHYELSSFLHFRSAVRCMEYCHLVIAGPLMILICFRLWQLLRGFNSVGSRISEDLSLWDWTIVTVVYHVLKFLYGILMHYSNY